MKPVKICFVSFLAYPLFNPAVSFEFGGAEVQLYYLATELAKDPRFEVVFLTGDFGQPASETREGVTIYKLFKISNGIKYLKTAHEYLRMALLLKKIHADVYIQRAAALLTGVVAVAAKSSGKKFIYMAAHDQDVMPEKPSWMLPGLVGDATWRLYKRGLKMADIVVVQHAKQRDELKRLYGKNGYIRPSAHRFSENSDAAIREFILWVARCEDWKQPELFLELARNFPAETFCMVCPGSHDVALFERIRSGAAAIPNIRFVEYVPFEEINGYFASAKIFVNTSKKEGFPNTFIQAMKNGTPVLSLNVDPDRLLEKQNVGQCAGGNFNALVKGLDKISKDGKLWGEMSANGYRYVSSRHDIRSIIEEDKKMLLDLFKAK